MFTFTLESSEQLLVWVMCVHASMFQMYLGSLQ